MEKQNVITLLYIRQFRRYILPFTKFNHKTPRKTVDILRYIKKCNTKTD